MLFPEKMCEVSIIVHKNYFDNLLESIHESGMLQIIDYNQSKSIDKKSLSSMEPSTKQIEVLTELILNINRLRDILKKTEPLPAGLYQQLKTYKPPSQYLVESRPIAEIIRDGRRLIADMDYILKLESEISNANSRRKNLKLQIERLQLFKKLKLNLNTFEDTQTIAIKVGQTDRPEQFKSELISQLSGLTVKDNQFALYFHPVPEGLEGFIVIIIVPKFELQNIRKVMVGRHFKELDFKGFEGTPELVLMQLNAELIETDKIISKSENELRSAYNKHFQPLIVLQEELELVRNKNQIQSKFGRTSSSQIICGWCLKRQLDALKQLCEDGSSGHAVVTVREPDKLEETEVPVSLNNPKWAKPFEMLTTTFAYPKYNEIDPTVIIAPLFVLFFGIMLGDAGYGMILLSFSLVGYFKFGHASRTIRTLSHIGIFAGIITITAGIIMGAFFGDFIPRFIYGDPDALLYSTKIFGFYLPYDSFRNPMLLFIISLIFGIFVLNLGFALGAMQNLKDGLIKKFITHQLSWFIIQPPAALLIGHSLLKIWIISDGIMILSLIVLTIGLFLLIIGYLGLAPFEITGYLGDWLSFARLIALSLATIGMALTINIVGELILNSGYNTGTFALSLILAAVFLGFIHLINFVLQTLGAAIHSLRLQYIELFNRCYEGGGTPFKPFYSNRSYTKIKSNVKKIK